MDLQQFYKDIERELELSILGKGQTPILDRLEIHLDALDTDYNLATMLSPKNLNVELYLSMVYQIVNPSRPKKHIKITFDNVEILGKNTREKIKNLVIKIGVDKIQSLPTYHRFLYKKDIGDVVGNAYKIVDENHFFDTSFGGVGATSLFTYFATEVKKTHKLDIGYEETFSYN
tara:strand:+ start:204 stop:725 length:522 start_codon:yes stop_codon:yes gene_type:complete